MPFLIRRLYLLQLTSQTCAPIWLKHSYGETHHLQMQSSFSPVLKTDPTYLTGLLFSLPAEGSQEAHFHLQPQSNLTGLHLTSQKNRLLYPQTT